MAASRGLLVLGRASLQSGIGRIASPDEVGPNWKAMLWKLAVVVAVTCAFNSEAQVTVPVVSTTNRLVRIAASNLSSGSAQAYEAPGIRILQGLRPDIIAMQEFNFGANSPADIQSLVNQLTFTNGSSWFRESGYTIPNGIISRWPILASGSWDDSDLPDRGFAWARIDLPGTNDLYVVSVHLKSASDSAARRSAQATQLKGLIQSSFPTNAWIVVAGDLNTYNTNEASIQVFSSFLKTSPDAVDNLGDPDTNFGRSSPYDHVFSSQTFSTNQVATVIGAQSFANGLVFDSRVFVPLSSVAPIQFGDSGSTGMQHMAVLKDFGIPYLVTNHVAVYPPLLSLQTPNRLLWNAPSNIAFQVETSATLSAWTSAGAPVASGTNYTFTNFSTAPLLFFRLRYP